MAGPQGTSILLRPDFTIICDQSTVSGDRPSRVLNYLDEHLRFAMFITFTNNGRICVFGVGFFRAAQLFLPVKNIIDHNPRGRFEAFCDCFKDDLVLV